ncbi:glycosyltransferase 87 family protein [Actinomadura sediminis]|uniref:Glycosyltransferase 87 family protein n=1 Tax=Actinomadura sediminis TaxID=1038904 RepID=A0ABW3ENX0_9ACTN
MKAQFRTPALYALCAAFAAATAAVTHLPPHRTWGALAAAAYTLAALASAAPRLRARRGVPLRAHRPGAARPGPDAPPPGSRLGAAAGRFRPRAGAVAGFAFAGAAVAPLAVLVATGQAQPEAGVVERSAAHLLDHGTPYRVPEPGEGYEAYNPYLPAMAVLGLPSALTGVDVRVVFTVAFVALFAASALLLRGRTALGPLTLLAASPLVALPLAVGGDDLPVLGLACLGLALAARGNPAAAGAVLGVAGAMKPTAWPVLAVCAALLVHRRSGGRRFAAAAGMVLAAGVAGPALADPRGFLENAVRFPMGLAGAASPADSPLPGRLLADLGAGGHAAALAALVLAAAAMAVSLAVRPPADVRAAALRVAAGLALATALMPASRWGYLVYPAVLVLWARIAARPRVRTEAELWLAA